MGLRGTVSRFRIAHMAVGRIFGFCVMRGFWVYISGWRGLKVRRCQGLGLSRLSLEDSYGVRISSFSGLGFDSLKSAVAVLGAMFTVISLDPQQTIMLLVSPYGP